MEVVENDMEGMGLTDVLERTEDQVIKIFEDRRGNTMWMTIAKKRHEKYLKNTINFVNVRAD
jgi:hypothetical protein